MGLGFGEDSLQLVACRLARNPELRGDLLQRHPRDERRRELGLRTGQAEYRKEQPRVGTGPWPQIGKGEQRLCAQKRAPGCAAYSSALISTGSDAIGKLVESGPRFMVANSQPPGDDTDLIIEQPVRPSVAIHYARNSSSIPAVCGTSAVQISLCSEAAPAAPTARNRIGDTSFHGTDDQFP